MLFSRSTKQMAERIKTDDLHWDKLDAVNLAKERVILDRLHPLLNA